MTTDSPGLLELLMWLAVLMTMAMVVYAAMVALQLRNVASQVRAVKRAILPQVKEVSGAAHSLGFAVRDLAGHLQSPLRALRSGVGQMRKHVRQSLKPWKDAATQEARIENP